MATQTPSARKQLEPETWGESLKRAVGRRHKPICDQLGELIGAQLIGSRTVFSRLYTYDAAPTDPGEVVRAWLLITASGWDTAPFGISDDQLPPLWDAKTLRRLLSREFGWLTGTADDADRLVLAVAS